VLLQAGVPKFTLLRLKLAFLAILITSKVLDVRRRGATTEAYGAIRRKPVESLKVEREERSEATPQMIP
jgi:hypothetical protein